MKLLKKEISGDYATLTVQHSYLFGLIKFIRKYGKNTYHNTDWFNIPNNTYISSLSLSRQLTLWFKIN